MPHPQAVSAAPKIDPRVLDMQARIEFLESTCRMACYPRVVSDDHLGKDFQRYCQGLKDFQRFCRGLAGQLEGLARRMVAPGATEDPDVCGISSEIQGIGAVLETMNLLYPKMGESQPGEPISGLFGEFFIYLSGLVDETARAWEGIALAAGRNE